MATSKIKKGDTVRVIAGKDKGREGKVSSVKNGKSLLRASTRLQNMLSQARQIHRVVSYSRMQQLMYQMLCMLAMEKLHVSDSRLKMARRFVMQKQLVK